MISSKIIHCYYFLHLTRSLQLSLFFSGCMPTFHCKTLVKSKNTYISVNKQIKKKKLKTAISLVISHQVDLIKSKVLLTKSAVLCYFEWVRNQLYVFTICSYVLKLTFLPVLITLF